MPEHKNPPRNYAQAGREAITLAYLDSLRPGFQKPEVFRQLARLGGLDTVEVVPVRRAPNTESGLELGLVRRPADDYFWPNLLHVAGSIILEDDPIEHEHDYRPAIKRAIHELGPDMRFMSGPTELETAHTRGLRSREVTVRFWGEATGNVEPGPVEFYDAADVLRRAPELGIMEHHAALLERVTDAYILQRNAEQLAIGGPNVNQLAMSIG